METEGTLNKRYTIGMAVFLVVFGISLAMIIGQLNQNKLSLLVIGICFISLLGLLRCAVLLHKQKKAIAEVVIPQPSTIVEHQQEPILMSYVVEDECTVETIIDEVSVASNEVFEQEQSLASINQQVEEVDVIKPEKQTKSVVQVDSFKAFQRENELISKTLNKTVMLESDTQAQQVEEEQFIQLSLDEYFSEDLVRSSHVTEAGETLGRFEQQIYNQITTILKQHNRDLTKIKPKYTGSYFDIVGDGILLRFKLQGRKQYVLTQLSLEEVKAKTLIAQAPSKTEKYKTRIPMFSMYVLDQLTDYILQRYDEVC